VLRKEEQPNEPIEGQAAITCECCPSTHERTVFHKNAVKVDLFNALMDASIHKIRMLRQIEAMGTDVVEFHMPTAAASVRAASMDSRAASSMSSNIRLLDYQQRVGR
jgi:hypothetical protein